MRSIASATGPTDERVFKKLTTCVPRRPNAFANGLHRAREGRALLPRRAARPLRARPPGREWSVEAANGDAVDARRQPVRGGGRRHGARHPVDGHQRQRGRLQGEQVRGLHRHRAGPVAHRLPQRPHLLARHPPERVLLLEARARRRGRRRVAGIVRGARDAAGRAHVVGGVAARARVCV